MSIGFQTELVSILGHKQTPVVHLKPIIQTSRLFLMLNRYPDISSPFVSLYYLPYAN